MTKEEKIASLAHAMTTKKRPDETTFTCFSDTAPEELKNLFLDHYAVRDIEYMIFADACDIMDTLLQVNNHRVDEIDTLIHDDTEDSASPMTADRLGYLYNWNQDEITKYVQTRKIDIATACAFWYDDQVQNACFIIKNWIQQK